MMKLLFFDMNTIRDREALHDALHAKLELPACYGRNLDALYDLLSEGSVSAMLVFENCSRADEGMNEYLEKLREIGERLSREGQPAELRIFP